MPKCRQMAEKHNKLVFTFRFSTEGYAAELREQVEKSGLNMNRYLANLVAAHLDAVHGRFDRVNPRSTAKREESKA